MSFEHLAPYGTDGSILNILVQQTDLFLFYLTKQAEERKETGHHCSLCFHLKQQAEINKYAIMEQDFAIKAKWMHFKSLCEESLQLTTCIWSGGILFVICDLVIASEISYFQNWLICCYGTKMYGHIRYLPSCSDHLCLFVFFRYDYFFRIELTGQEDANQT